MKPLFLKQRLYALVIDLFLISILAYILQSMIDFNSLERYKVSFLNLKWVLDYDVNFSVMVLYFLAFDFLSNGVSFGKNINKLELKNNETNSIPNLLVRIFRTLLKSFFLTILFPITIIYFLVKEKVVYDKLLNTSVNYCLIKKD